MVDYNFNKSTEFNNIVKNLLNNPEIKEIETFIEHNKMDERKFVQKGLEKLSKFIEEEKLEALRLVDMYSIEKEVYSKGYEYIIGIDEVGRGPYAGPVTVAGVILKKDSVIKYVNDSKKLKKDLRSRLNKEIEDTCVDKIILSASNEDIDNNGIKTCNLALMESCVKYFLEKGYTNSFCLVDAEKIPNLPIPQMSIIKGDSKSSSIASASILAKVYRDTFMENMSEMYPEYDFASNTGYNSPKHLDAIIEYGICPIHRKSFVRTALRNKGIDNIGSKYNIELY